MKEPQHSRIRQLAEGLLGGLRGKLHLELIPNPIGFVYGADHGYEVLAKELESEYGPVRIYRIDQEGVRPPLFREMLGEGNKGLVLCAGFEEVSREEGFELLSRLNRARDGISANITIPLLIYIPESLREDSMMYSADLFSHRNFAVRV